MAKKKIDTKKCTYDEWVALRKCSLGGSDASTVLGKNKWSSLLSLYAEKKGLTSDKETSVAMMVGTHCEELVAQMFCEETGKKVRNDFMMYEHDLYPYITANLDRRVIGENAGLECKTTQAYTLKDFENGVPDNYLYQCQHYMAVMGFDKMYLACIIGNRQFVWKEVLRDEDLIKKLICAEVIFWTEYVAQDIPPEADGSDASAEAIREMYADSDGETVDLDVDELVREYLDASAEEKDAKKRKDTAQQKIQQMLGNASIGIGSHSKVTWKAFESSRFDSKKFKEDYPELYEQYSKTMQTRRFTAKEITE